jgi:hypothetical protein
MSRNSPLNYKAPAKNDPTKRLSLGGGADAAEKMLIQPGMHDKVQIWRPSYDGTCTTMRICPLWEQTGEGGHWTPFRDPENKDRFGDWIREYYIGYRIGGGRQGLTLFLYDHNDPNYDAKKNPYILFYDQMVAYKRAYEGGGGNPAWLNLLEGKFPILPEPSIVSLLFAILYEHKDKVNGFPKGGDPAKPRVLMALKNTSGFSLRKKLRDYQGDPISPFEGAFITFFQQGYDPGPRHGAVSGRGTGLGRNTATEEARGEGEVGKTYNCRIDPAFSGWTPQFVIGQPRDEAEKAQQLAQWKDLQDLMCPFSWDNTLGFLDDRQLLDQMCSVLPCDALWTMLKDFHKDIFSEEAIKRATAATQVAFQGPGRQLTPEQVIAQSRAAQDGQAPLPPPTGLPPPAYSPPNNQTFADPAPQPPPPSHHGLPPSHSGLGRQAPPEPVTDPSVPQGQVSHPGLPSQGLPTGPAPRSVTGLPNQPPPMSTAPAQSVAAPTTAPGALDPLAQVNAARDELLRRSQEKARIAQGGSPPFSKPPQ